MAASLSSSVTHISAYAAIDAVIKEEIPVIDMSILRNATPNQRPQLIQEIGQACKEWGCFSLINHGVPESLRTLMMEAFTEFFDLSEEERREYLGKRILDPIRHEMGISTTAEGEKYSRDFVRIFVHPAMHSPSKPLHFRAILEEYARQTREIANDLLTAIGESLGLDESYMEKALDLANGHQILVGNRYPPSPQAHQLALGLSAHSDTPLLSVVMQNGSIHGLQVMHNGRWIPVQLIPGSFFIHTGDLLEIVSNGKYKSLLHRVMLDERSTRISVVTAMGPPVENIVAPAPKLVEIVSKNSVFPSIKYVDYVELVKYNPFGKSVLDLLRI
ncbi:protein DMR6-LIKE OXYGENASE 2 [Dendrobium catenatum]|uniref:protein DMR6-LIKE OXYGENASE 2 n=1 Tax=Dendrobium catenatum TaxID=906689 RepID=UPI0009F63468|nr:protein DMR6-LIKE OXYGENASE 2 [Dendrobium catenatum]